MIKIKKPVNAPVVNDKYGNNKLTTERDSNNNSYDLHPNDYDIGVRKFTFNNAIYGHTNIKTQLRNCQFGKCAFCEQNVTSVSHGDIEHFRPKKGFQQNLKDSHHYAGYYWLAYEWDNFLFTCEICNQRYKKNLFPLLNCERRAKNHHDNWRLEKPFFIKPDIENPRLLIKFDKALAIGVDKRHRGKKTIEAIGLNRKGNGISDLYELRNDYYELIKVTYDQSKKVAGPQLTQAEIDKAKELMKKYRSKRMKFSAMINDNFPA